jgi:LuxR family maltose regulon positive regulatory protein
LDGIAVALDRMTPVPWINLFALTLLSEITFELGDIEGTIRWSAAARRQLAAWPDAGILRGRLEQLQRAVEERRLAGHLTPMERLVLNHLATHLTLPEIARLLCISHNALKTHVRDLFRKLEVHSRSAAVERAREIGLLKN